jgi:radical SAM superfamily enzyme YgiQ (UPF0313 family)
LWLNIAFRLYYKYFDAFVKTMKILLIQPPIRDFYQTSIRTQPIGLAYLAASLRAQSHEVEILDCQNGRKRSIPIPPELSYLRDFYPFNDQSPFKLYSGFYHFGMGWEEIRRRIKASKADVFGISSSFTPYHGEALEIARIIKEWDQKKIVVMGGSHASGDSEGVLGSPCVDYVILGEGEIRFPLLLERIETGNKGKIGEIDGIGYREDGKIRVDPLQGFVQDLDALPYPARDLLDPDRYRMKRVRSTMLITSRGCPHQCAYCSAHLVMGNSFRTRSPEAILAEMKECRECYGIQVFDFEDDNFSFDRGRAKRLLRLVLEAFGEGALHLSAMNGISFSSLDGELLRLMKKAGFDAINLSFVSADVYTKERMKRPATEVGFDQIVEEAEQAGLSVIAYGIFGMPGQTIEEMLDTLIDLMGKRVLIGPSIYYPTPGTPLFLRCRGEGILPAYPSQWRSTAFPIETKEFNRLDLVTLFRLTRVINFIKGKMNQAVFDEGSTWRELSQRLKEKVQTEDENGRPQAWVDLLVLFLNERSFFGLRKDAEGDAAVIKEMSSQRVVDGFFEKAWNKPVRKS